MRRTTAAALAAGSIALVVTACSVTSPSAPATGPTAADAALVSQGVETSLESSIASFIGGVTPPVQGLGGTGGAVRNPYLRLAHVPLELVKNSQTHGAHAHITTRGGLGNAPSCVTASPNPPTDTDGDGIPDTVTITAQPNCTFQPDSGSSFTLSISGSMIEGDPTPTVADADYMATVNNLVLGFSSGSDSATIGLSGTAQVTETTGSLSEGNQLTLTLASTGTDTVNAAYAQNWMATFAYSGGTLLGSGGLPAGTLTITGTTNYTGNGKSFALAMSTPTPLTYDPTCQTNSQITAGVMQATFSGTNGADYVTLTWTGCQDPTVDFVSTGGQ